MFAKNAKFVLFETLERPDRFDEGVRPQRAQAKLLPHVLWHTTQNAQTPQPQTLFIKKDDEVKQPPRVVKYIDELYSKAFLNDYFSS